MIRKAATIEEKADKKATDEALVFKHGVCLALLWPHAADCIHIG
jgi:hypothetical protein